MIIPLYYSLSCHKIIKYSLLTKPSLKKDYYEKSVVWSSLNSLSKPNKFGAIVWIRLLGTCEPHVGMHRSNRKRWKMFNKDVWFLGWSCHHSGCPLDRQVKILIIKLSWQILLVYIAITEWLTHWTKEKQSICITTKRTIMIRFCSSLNETSETKC